MLSTASSDHRGPALLAARPLRSARAMYAALQRGDASYDSVFYAGVRTTGIFCRPSCRAKKPLRENVQFFSSAADALFAGFRACKRCRPLSAHGQHPPWAGELLSAVDAGDGARLRERDLCRMQIDPARARRYFQAHFGMTFQAYSRSRRLGAALSHLRRGQSLDDAAAESGYASLSGFREAFAKVFGAPPGKADRAHAIVVGYIDTPVGPMIAGSRDGAIVIPCHRVVNKDGQLGGYGGGVWRKRALLDLEQRARGPDSAGCRATPGSRVC